jgi:sialic acid synthase SpsE/sugar phosphate isomerase/epimerase
LNILTNQVTIKENDTVLHALDLLEGSRFQTVFVVDNSGILKGLITNGDVRRYLLGGGKTSDDVKNCMNSSYRSVSYCSSSEDVRNILSSGISVVPKIDEQGRLIDIVANGYHLNSNFKIDGHEVGGEKIFVIAEIGNNHNGSFDIAIELIEAAIAAGADCVKFQIRDNHVLYRKKESGSAEDLGVEYIKDLLNKVELSRQEHKSIRDFCKKKNITYMCTPWDESSVDFLSEIDVPAIKIASADLFNPYLIKKAASLGIPLIISTGMAYESEILDVVGLLNSLQVPYALLHCNSTYPAPEGDIQLEYIKRLADIHQIIGYSGHERGIAISLAAVALGAKIIERHITLDREMEGPDHLASLEPKEFAEMVVGIRQIEKAIPYDGTGRVPSQGELLNRENLSKSIIASRDIAEGEIFAEADFYVASPGQGLAPYRLTNLIGKKANRSIKKNQFLFEGDLNTERRSHYNFKFENLWGIPVRYHDFADFNKIITPDLYEFHLSYKDLDLNPKNFLSATACRRLVVHAPELFEDSELLDLVSADVSYLKRSIENLKRVVDLTHQIGEYFPNADGMFIVANIGGFSVDSPKHPLEIPKLYQRFQDNCSKLDFGKTEILPQNMPPFPWHFGGQRFHNIFMMPDEIIKYAQSTGIQICLDLSHLQLTCSYFKLNFQHALLKLLPVTAHIHASDAKGLNGEGVNMGSGDIDWIASWKKISRYKKISFIPEIWQGHKDHGAGFWNALDFLEKLNNFK